MIVYLIKRLLSVAVTFFIVSLVIFLMMHAVPGGPFTEKDMPLSDAVKAALNARLGLDKPLWVQYTNYMAGVLQGNWGVPYQSPGETVISLLQQAWLPSLILGGSGVIIGAALGILIGMAAALKRNSWIDYLASTKIEPVAVPMNIGRNTVTIGMAELRRTCWKMIRRSLSPLARSAVTNGRLSVSSIADRV